MFSRLPRIGVLVSSIVLVLIVPLTAVGIIQWRDANARVESAHEATVIIDDVAELLRLTPALTAEQLSTSVSADLSELIPGLPEGALAAVGMDYSATMQADQAVVDALVTEIGDVELEAEIARVRAAADEGGSDVLDIAGQYGALIDDLILLIDTKMAQLYEAATVARDGEITLAAAVAQRAAGVHVVATGQPIKWAQLASAQFLPPAAETVSEFAASVTLFEERSANLERLLEPGSATTQEWQALQDSDTTKQLLAHYDEMVESFIVSGLPELVVIPGGLDLSDINVAEVLTLSTELNLVLDLGDEMNEGLTAVVDSALFEVDQAAAAANDAAMSDRDLTLGWIVVAALLVGGLALVLFLTVARPVKRMAAAADELGQGRLDVRLPERGPTEVRVGARALNDALSSLQIAESQAIALAEERLDDPVLGQSAPGNLGASLQSAVRRLASSLTERDEFQRRLAHEASHDGLTKLPNRNAILRHLESGLARTRRANTSLALLFLDIDEFKSINDLYGHQFGDVALRTIAQRLLGTIRRGDLAGRLGGDEFIVVAEPVAGLSEASELSKRILDVVTQPITFEGRTIVPSVSIGIGLADGELTADELLRDADLAVYRAKSLGKGRIDVCDEDLRNEIQARTSLERAIRAALNDGEFVLHYQPTIDTVSQAITSVEALIRWERPGIGLLPPAEFIPAAERSELILDIDAWVLEQASAQLQLWRGHPTLGSLPIAVNISGRHLGSGRLFRDVTGALAASTVDPEMLILEVTETALLEDLATAARELTQLRGVGVRIALDDFGTGYMSLAHLRELPVDILKIDRSFVSAVDTDTEHSLIRLIVDTGHLLGAVVTAEGVETPAQAEALTAMGSDFLQGFLFSQPTDAATIEQFAVPAAQKVGSESR